MREVGRQTPRWPLSSTTAREYDWNAALTTFVDGARQVGVLPLLINAFTWWEFRRGHFLVAALDGVSARGVSPPVRRGLRARVNWPLCRAKGDLRMPVDEVEHPVHSANGSQKVHFNISRCTNSHMEFAHGKIGALFNLVDENHLSSMTYIIRLHATAVSTSAWR